MFDPEILLTTQQTGMIAFGPHPIFGGKGCLVHQCKASTSSVDPIRYTQSVVCDVEVRARHP